MATVQMAGNGFGGIVEGNYGTYQQASDGTFTVDTRDVAAMITLGMTFVQNFTEQYSTTIAVPAAAVGGVISSGALSNGTLAVTTQPSVPRPLNFEVGAGTLAITAGTATVTYVASDTTTQVDTLSLVCAANASVTQGLSKGVITISSVVIAGVTGGASPWVRASTTAAISLPVSKGTSLADVSVQREYDGSATAAVGTLGVTVGSIFPTTPPNGTLIYSFVYSYLSSGT